MKVVFMGTPAAAVPTLQRLLADGHEILAVYTQPDRPSGRGGNITFSPVKQFAVQHGLEVEQPVKVKTPEAAEKFRSLGADVAVVVAYGRILPEAFLRAYPKGAINVHFSLLPKYRGAAPVNWAIANGETRTGVSTMQMDAGLDTGDILLRRAVEIGKNETAPELMSRLASLGAELLSETLKKYHQIEPTRQHDSKATYAPIMTKEDGLADWSLPAATIADRVRGFQPFPGVFTFLNGKRLAIWRASLEPDAEMISDSPGVILVAKGDDLLVSCGEGSTLRVHEVQPEGKRRMPVRDFINGMRPQVGSFLGS